MALIIPMKDLPDYTEEVTLDGRPYILRFRWNTRGAFWVMAIYDRNEVLLVDGVRLVIGFPLNKHIENPLLPPGEFFCIDTNTTTRNIEPGRKDFISERSVSLGYVPKYEV